MSAFPTFTILILVFAASLLGSAIQAASGFGYGVFVMSVLPFILPYNEALCMTGIVAAFTSAAIALKHRQHVRLRLILLPLLGYFVASSVGTYFLKSQPDGALKRILGGFLIALAIYLMRFNDKVRVRTDALTGIAAGGLSGVMGSLFSMSGPPIVIYMLAAATTTSAYIASIQIYFVCTSVYISFARLLGGMMGRNVAVYAGVGILGALLGARVGHTIFRRMSAERLRMTVYSFMVAMGVLMLVTG